MTPAEFLKMIIDSLPQKLEIIKVEELANNWYEKVTQPKEENTKYIPFTMTQIDYLEIGERILLQHNGKTVIPQITGINRHGKYTDFELQWVNNEVTYLQLFSRRSSDLIQQPFNI